MLVSLGQLYPNTGPIQRAFTAHFTKTAGLQLSLYFSRFSHLGSSGFVRGVGSVSSCYSAWGRQCKMGVSSFNVWHNSLVKPCELGVGIVVQWVKHLPTHNMWHPISECLFQSYLLPLHSSSPLTHLGEQQKMAQTLGPYHPSGKPDEVLAPGYNLAAVAIWGVNKQVEEDLLFLSPSISVSFFSLLFCLSNKENHKKKSVWA